MEAAKGFGVDFATTLMNSLQGQKVKRKCTPRGPLVVVLQMH